MASELFITPSRATNSNGLNIDGAKWFFYLTGTTTKESVFTTSALSVAHANPVVADAAGKFANIYLNPVKTYRAVLKTADEATIIYDIDPVNSDAGVFLQSGAGANARTVQDKLRDVISVKDFGATGDGSTNDAASIGEALTYAGTIANGATVEVPAGVYVCGATGLTVPQKVTLKLNSGAKITSSATNAITVTLGAFGLSGSVVGDGYASLIEHTGTGAGILLNGTGESQADVYLANFRLKGSSAGAAGILGRKFNRMITENVKVYDYTAGDALRSEGANSVTHINPHLSGCLNGVHNLTLVSSGNFTSNAIQVIGGQITFCTGWGWYEDVSGGAGVNLGNGAIGTTFENNGTNLSGTTGHLFIQNSDAFNLTNCYVETVTGTVPTSAIIVGDVSNAPKGTCFTGNVFQTLGTNTISNVNGASTFIEGNILNGTTTNFVNNGTASRNLYLGQNRSVATNYFAGSDGGSDSVVFGGTGTLLNQQGPTIRGYGFNTLSGLNQDLVIRTRGGGTNSILFQDSGGSSVASVADNGTINTTAAYQVDGTQVVSNRATGYGAPTGTATRTTFATGSVTLPQLAERVKALIDDLTTHGLIGS